ncbi:MAG: hypothetical protein ACRD5Z_22060 [Bryobacteraceae bacterium]
MTGKTTILAHDHAELDQLLAEFFSVLSAHEIEKSFAMLDCFWARLAVHIRAEHLHLFPSLLRALERPAQENANEGLSSQIARSTISRLQADHDFFMRELAAAVKQLRELRSSAHGDESEVLLQVQQQVEGIRRRLEAHNELEESQVYSWPRFLLEPAERVSLTESMQRELNDFPSRFRSGESLRSRI